MHSELLRTCKALGIPYGRGLVDCRGRGIVWHNTRHSCVTNLVASGTAEAAAAMTITGHVDPTVFRRYNDVRRDDAQDALARHHAYLARRRSKQVPESSIGHDNRARRRSGAS
jgi:integrase